MVGKHTPKATSALSQTQGCSQWGGPSFLTNKLCSFSVAAGGIGALPYGFARTGKSISCRSSSLWEVKYYWWFPLMVSRLLVVLG